MSAQTASALPATLKSVTATKIAELKKQREIFETEKFNINDSVKRRKLDHDKAKALVEGGCKLEGVRLIDDPSDDEEYKNPYSNKSATLQNQYRLLRQAGVDPAFSPSVVKHIGQDVIKDLNLTSIQHQHAQFFSELVTEWIGKPEQEKSADSKLDTSGASPTFENVGRREMHEQRAEWESYVFSDAVTDKAAIKSYLDTLFKQQKHVKQAHEDLRKAVDKLSHSLKGDVLVSVESLKTTIKGTLASDLLNDDKQAILKTFQQNKEVLKEVADVINMRFKSLDTWQWTINDGAIDLEQRRQLNGKYRVYMNEDVLDALLIHAIGMRWAVGLRPILIMFFQSHAWKRGTNKIPLTDRERREWFLGVESNNSTVATRRDDDFSEDYFLTQLPANETESYRSYDDDDSDEPEPSSRKNPLETKHHLLHLLMTEALLARQLRPDHSHAVIRSDFKWFGPSLPHQTIFTVLEHLGVDSFWLKFFHKFLQPPLRFVQDGPNGQIQTRKRGVPMSHILSDVLSECVLFVMDYAVNHATNGYLYRLHDDFWFWGDLETCKTAWHHMATFAKVMGIDFNEEKTGSFVFSQETPTPSSAVPVDTKYEGLPTGSVRWGFLQLSPATGRFTLDQNQVDEHIKELRLQLESTSSMFAWVQAYNAYFARFFTNNFGKPSFAFGRLHVDDIISTFSRIQKSLFPHGHVISHLSSMVQERWSHLVDSSDVPDGFYYFPISFGGLELRNPFIPLLCMRETIRISPEKILEKALKADEAHYLSYKDIYERTNTGTGLGKYNAKLLQTMNEDGDNFMPKEEYLKWREERSTHLRAAYDQLLSVPDEEPLAPTAELYSMVGTVEGVARGSPAVRSRGRGASRLGRRGMKKEPIQDWNMMEPYWKWIVAEHGKEVVDRYGGLKMVNEAQVPLGIVGVMKQGKIRWQG